MKSIGIMQAYFMPYIGYFQLINAVDEFVIYDNIQYSKGGWINRNRILQGGKDKYITLALKKDSDYLDIRDRYLSDSFDSGKILRQIETAYHKAPYYDEIYNWLEDLICYNDRNLFSYILNSVKQVCNFLDINTPIIISSQMQYDNTLKGQEKVIAICKKRNCTRYINAIGGTKLYQAERFMCEGMELRFLQTKFQEYSQFTNPFIAGLSIIDVLMFNSKEVVQQMLLDYQLIEGVL